MSALSRDDASVELQIDGSFTGILRGRTDDMSEGCQLKGVCVLHVHKPLRVSKLSVFFEGQCKVSIKTSTTVGKPGLEGAESQILIRRALSLNKNQKEAVEFQPGDYTYPFRFDLPSTLPASFRGKRGFIRYRLEAVVYRPPSFVIVVNKQIRTRMDICLRRCLLSDTILNIPLMDTIHGEDHTDKITYSATAPTIVYREGGLVPLNLMLCLDHPDSQSVQSVTCALRERIAYQTTGQQSMSYQIVSRTDDLYPLGWSAFYPSRSENYNPHQKQEYNAEFRLCPRVNADCNMPLIKISHVLAVYIVVRDTTVGIVDHGASRDSSPVPSSTTPPHRCSSTSSLESLVKEAANAISSTIKRKSVDSTHLEDSPPLSPKSITSIACREHLKQHHMYVCSLEFPIVVTSRERYWESNYPTPPAYGPAGDPPTYRQTLVQLPPAPAYD
ncbi:hypothetical protein BX666DRAFT_1887460 [Dichotomocladium elegans]|nr:hypothetical protein BX666DRAFT_1887460 [Dichotomocladium elegans]